MQQVCFTCACVCTYLHSEVSGHTKSDCVCIHVCVYHKTRDCETMCMKTHVQMRPYTSVHVCTYVGLRIYMCLTSQSRTINGSEHAYMHTCTHKYEHKNKHTHACANTHTRTQTQTWGFRSSSRCVARALTQNCFSTNGTRGSMRRSRS